MNKLTILLTALVLMALVAGLAVSLDASAATAEDERQYQHGVDIVPRGDGNYWLIWSSSGNPPTGPDPSGSWTHDIYYSLIQPANPSINPVTIISNNEAQEPASSAVSADGNLMITNEDGWNVANNVGQRYGVYRASDFGNVKAYPNMIQGERI